MVEQITAWRDGAGRVHETESEAQKADALIALGNAGINEGAANRLLGDWRQCAKVIEALRPFAHTSPVEEGPARG